jgi:hypothetical protein
MTVDMFREVEGGLEKLREVKFKLHSIHKCLLYLTKYKQPNKQGYDHESYAVSKTGVIKTAYTEHGIAEGFYEWGKGIQSDPEPQLITGDG